MNRKAQVAYTPNDKDNVNRLRVPDFGLAKLVVKTKHLTSQAHQPAGVVYTPAHNDGTDEFHFAPEKETAQIVYLVNDPFGLVRGAKLELFRRHKPEPLWTLDLATFGATWWSHGEHVVAWDGRIVKPDKERNNPGQHGRHEHVLTDIKPDLTLADFPDGYVTLEHTTYKLKMTIKADELAGDPGTAWTYFHVMAEKLTLSFGPETVLPAPVADQANHRTVRASVLAQGANPPKPSDGKIVKVFLDSDLFRHGAGEMLDNTLFTAYQDLWGDGPLIPLFAKVTILTSEDKGVEAPKAIGKAKFLWEWESKNARVATGKHSDSFVNDAQNYHVKGSKPKGGNCHFDRGGKRGGASTAVFPAQAGYAPADALTDGNFPFKVEAVPDKRKWAAYSYAWREKLLASQTGVLFQPSRMAGDAYQVNVYLAWDVGADDKNRLDVDTEPLVVPSPERVSANAGIFQIWRRTHLRKHLAKKDDATPALSLDTIAECYRDAYVALSVEAGARQTVPEAEWNQAIVDATAGWPAEAKLVLAEGSQYSRSVGVVFRSRDEFTEAFARQEMETALTTLGCGDAAATIAQAACGAPSAAEAFDRAKAAAIAEGCDVPDQQDQIATEAQSQWESIHTSVDDPASGMNTRASYAATLEEKAIEVLTTVFDGHFDADPGVTIFQVAAAHNLVGDMTEGMTLGEARDFPSVQTIARPTRCGFLLMSPVGELSPDIVLNKACAHEIGHHFFLPHSKDSAEKQDHRAHDQVTPSKCLMSYNMKLDWELCGFCQLRLRGWNKDVLNPKGSLNKKSP
jgi:hypothetical protein